MWEQLSLPGFCRCPAVPAFRSRRFRTGLPCKDSCKDRYKYAGPWVSCFETLVPLRIYSERKRVL